MTLWTRAIALVTSGIVGYWQRDWPLWSSLLLHTTIFALGGLAGAALVGKFQSRRLAKTTTSGGGRH
jgi:hypothetical protein